MRRSFQEIPKLQVVAAGHGAYNFKGVCIQSTIFLDAWPRSLWKQDSQQPSTLQYASSICADNRRKKTRKMKHNKNEKRGKIQHHTTKQEQIDLFHSVSHINHITNSSERCYRIRYSLQFHNMKHTMPCKRESDSPKCCKLWGKAAPDPTKKKHQRGCCLSLLGTTNSRNKEKDKKMTTIAILHYTNRKFNLRQCAASTVQTTRRTIRGA